MVFSTSSFLFLFLPAVVLVYALLEKVCPSCRNLFLFAVSLVFYCWNGTAFLPVLLLCLLTNYIIALLIGRFRERRIKGVFLFVGVAADVLILGYYKYAGFLVSVLSSVSGRQIPAPDVVLPLGISFYIFQSISYLIDVYRGSAALTNPIDLGTYITFFPQLIAGPIVRYDEIKASLFDRRMNPSAALDGFERFLIGLSKKVVLANGLGKITDLAFAANAPISTRSGLTLWLAAWAFTLQLYYDFSGYSDMAIGLGRIFGFSFPENFNTPYCAGTITEFWRRWHMTLSRWFRDYLYIPLGGSRRGTLRHLLNLLIVWSITGLWHGAGWQYLLWGQIWFILLVIEKYLIRPERIRSQRWKVVYQVVVWLCICLQFVLFNAKSPETAWRIIQRMLRFVPVPWADAYSLFVLRDNLFYFGVGTLFCFPVMRWIGERNAAMVHLLRSVILLAGTILSIAFILRESYNPFLYFQF